LKAAEGEDILAWSLEKSSTPRSSDSKRALCSQEGTTMGTSSEEDMWISLWKLHVLSKVNVLWWHAMWGIFSDAVTLNHRHIKEIGR
jgi:hypothetical protein